LKTWSKIWQSKHLPPSPSCISTCHCCLQGTAFFTCCAQTTKIKYEANAKQSGIVHLEWF
jgi:hypothetical protein